MKTLCLIIAFLISLICLDLNAQSKSDTSIELMMAETEKQIVSIENDYQYIIKVEIGISKISSPTFSSVELVSGRTYNFHLRGEFEKIKDIDLKIHQKVNDNLIEIEHENSISNIIETSYEPERTDYYELEIILKDLYEGYSEGTYALIISFPI